MDVAFTVERALVEKPDKDRVMSEAPRRDRVMSEALGWLGKGSDDRV